LMEQKLNRFGIALELVTPRRYPVEDPIDTRRVRHHSSTSTLSSKQPAAES
jgi:hypothetical protein